MIHKRILTVKVQFSYIVLANTPFFRNITDSLNLGIIILDIFDHQIDLYTISKPGIFPCICQDGIFYIAISDGFEQFDIPFENIRKWIQRFWQLIKSIDRSFLIRSQIDQHFLMRVVTQILLDEIYLSLEHIYLDILSKVFTFDIGNDLEVLGIVN